MTHVWTKRPSGVMDYRPEGESWHNLYPTLNHIAWVAYRGGSKLYAASVHERTPEGTRFHDIAFRSHARAKRWCEEIIAALPSVPERGWAVMPLYEKTNAGWQALLPGTERRQTAPPPRDPRAARDVPQGTPWAFLNHRTQAAVMADEEKEAVR